MSWYAASTAAPYRLGFIHLDWDGWILVVERKVAKWGASSLAWHFCQVKSCKWVCAESLCKVKVAYFCNKLSFSPLTYILGFSHGGVRDSLTHFVHLKRDLELLWVFDSLSSLSRCVVYVWLCYVLVLFVSGGWYSSCSDTRSLFTWHCWWSQIMFDSRTKC